MHIFLYFWMSLGAALPATLMTATGPEGTALRLEVGADSVIAVTDVGRGKRLTSGREIRPETCYFADYTPTVNVLRVTVLPDAVCSSHGSSGWWMAPGTGAAP